MLIRLAVSFFSRLGYDLVKKGHDNSVADIKEDHVFMEIYELCKNFTMTSIERLYSLYQAVNYIVDHKISGDFVECGVWKGGSSMMIALTLSKRNDVSRSLFLYDTFEGMSEPTEMDKTFRGEYANELLRKQSKEDSNSVWCFASLKEVQHNMRSTAYPPDKVKFIVGKVEDTLNNTAPEKIALLRLDTDWYESTRKELEVLYPKLNEKGGVLIVDDFGHWQGAKKAVQEYFQASKPLLHRIDNTGRILVKNT